jgi:type II secretory ATPase GspE/PulE/Tfp pilus assembly ATPase PilB-like protein
MDPDVMVLGEMRDEETARVMLRASMTGHLVFSTLHTNSATATIGRLVDMGISRVLLSDPQLLVCLISQRLLPLLCAECKLSLQDEIFLRNTESACRACNGSGIGSRTVIAEVIWIDDEGRKFIQSGDMLGWGHYLREQQWQSYQERAISLVNQGLADLHDVEKLTGVTLSH